MNTEGFPAYFKAYIEKVKDTDSIAQLEQGAKEVIRSLALVSDEEANKGYAEGKWSIKEVVQHIIDTERIFVYRALTIARGKDEVLSGYDHEQYTISSNANRRKLKDLLEELKRLRSSTIDFFQSLDDEMKSKTGKANGFDIKVEQFLYILIGHELHHLQILHERYL